MTGEFLLPEGVFLRPLIRSEDGRGRFSEMYRAEWFGDLPAVRQYQIMESDPNVLRGFHVHAVHHDYLCVVSGAFLAGLKDMRPWSLTFGLSLSLTMDSKHPASLQIPPGVGHGFYFDQNCTLLLGVSHYWADEDEMACRWDDPDLDIDWRGVSEPNLSERDRAASSFSDMQKVLLSRIQCPRSE